MKLIEGRNGYLYVEYSEPYQFNKLIDLMKEVLVVCETESYQKFLVNISEMTGKVATMERFELALKGVSLFRFKGKYAIVYRKEEINRFAENVGANRGLNALMFSDMDEALKWLGVMKSSDQWAGRNARLFLSSYLPKNKSTEKFIIHPSAFIICYNPP